MSFPGNSDGKESACNTGDLGSISGSGRSPGEGNGYPRQYSCLENSMDRRNPFLGHIALCIAPLKCLMITQIGKRNQESVTSGISQVCMTLLLQKQAGAAEPPLVAEAAITSQKSLQEKSCPEQNWKRQAMPSFREDKSQLAGECRGRSG